MRKTLLLFIILNNLFTLFSQENELRKSGLDTIINKNQVVEYDHIYGIFLDIRDQKEYKTVTINSQLWFAENLNYEVEESWCYKGDCSEYGRLYSWEVALEVCPEGWTLPSEDDWMQLASYLNGQNVAGGKLKKEKGWKLNHGINYGYNETGFSGLPGGFYFYADSTFGNAGRVGYWWSGTAYGLERAIRISMDYYDQKLYFIGYDRMMGYSVRCIKNNDK